MKFFLLYKRQTILVFKSLLSVRFNLIKLVIFFQELSYFNKLSEKIDNNLSAKYQDIYPCLNDKTETTPIDYHYVYHTAWASRVIAKIKPSYHIDIASYLYFSTLISAFVPVDFYDYRPANIKLSNLNTKSADLLNLPFEDSSIDSLSCMHVIEHIGLGRYGDLINPNGDLHAIKEIIRVLSPNGSFLFVVPIGIPRIMFNAHRIYSYEQIKGFFPDFHLQEFMLIPDNVQEAGLIYNPEPDFINQQNYGCGCFWFKKSSKILACD